jgi:hypothetical protein
MNGVATPPSMTRAARIFRSPHLRCSALAMQVKAATGQPAIHDAIDAVFNVDATGADNTAPANRDGAVFQESVLCCRAFAAAILDLQFRPRI